MLIYNSPMFVRSCGPVMMIFYFNLLLLFLGNIMVVMTTFILVYLAVLRYLYCNIL